MSESILTSDPKLQVEKASRERAIALVNSTRCEALRPDAWITVSEWADKYRVLSQKAASEPGRWRTDRTPYLREIMDCLSSNSPVSNVVFMKGAQIGGTECGANWIGYSIHQAPGPMLSVQPTVEMAKRNSKQRIASLIDESSELKALVKESREKDSGNTILSKEFPGGVLVMTGANSAVGLRSMPAKYLFLDEIDAYPGDADGEGDPVALAEARTRTFGRKKIFKVSTPTIEGISRIAKEYEASDQRRYWVPCPECNEYQVLAFRQLQWPKGEPDGAHYICEHCGAVLGEEHKTEMLERGEWRAEFPERKQAAGFHLSSLYSPVGWMSWRDIAHLWMKAQGSTELLKQFANTVLGETWCEAAEAPDWKRLYDRREDYKNVPRGGLFLTAGADVQKDRIEVTVWAWGRGLESWFVEHRVLRGDTSRAEVWEELSQMASEKWEHENGAEMSIVRFAIDTRYNTNEVYRWARGRPTVVPVIGMERGPGLVGTPRDTEVLANGKRKKRGVKAWPIVGPIAKSELYGHLRLDAPTSEQFESGSDYPAGYVHLSKEASEEWVRQFVGEQIVIRVVKGYKKQEWQKTRDRNEALDTRVYARGAASIVGIDRFKEHHWATYELALGVDVAEKRRPLASEQQQPTPVNAVVLPRKPKIVVRRSSFMQR